MRKWQNNRAFRFFSSIRLAVPVILSLAAILAVATVAESLYGMRGAYNLVYGQYWFFGVLFLLGFNVLCAALSRYPWKKHQTGFVITHLGILILLLGSWVTHRFGVDGNLPVVEGFADGQVILNDMRLVLTDEDAATTQAYPVAESALRRDGKLLEVALPHDERLVVTSYLPRVRTQKVVEASPIEGMGSAAIRIELFNDRFNVEEWLTAGPADSPSELNLGPAVLSFQRLWSAEQEAAFKAGNLSAPKPSGGAKGYVVLNQQGKEYRVDIDAALKDWTPIGSTGLVLRVDRYMPYAVVEKNQLVNRSDEPRNPTVQVFIKNPQGQQEKHTLFANFPDFATLHKRSKKSGEETFGVQLRMIASSQPGASPAVRGKLYFAQSADGKRLLYRITATEGRLVGQGEAETGKEIPTGWMDLRFRVAERIQSAVTVEKPIYVERLPGGGESNFPAAIRLERSSTRTPASQTQEWWLVEGGSASVPIGNTVLDAAFTRDRIALPFSLQLNKFHMGTDPGTTKAATYESDVEVNDPNLGDRPKPAQRISMNEPLQYGGYTFYQSSYQLRDGQPPISVFSVNFDPGRWIKYLGSLVMVFGISVMFYLNPHYWGIIFGGKRKAS